MIKQLIQYGLLATALLFSTLASAEVKIGVVDLGYLIENAPQVKEAASTIEKEFAPREKELLALQRQIKTLEEKISTDGAIMSEAERGKLEREMLTKKRDFKRTNDEFREDYNIRRNEEFAKMQKLVIETSQNVGKERGYDLLLTEGIVYASDRVNITKDVLERLTTLFNGQ